MLFIFLEPSIVKSMISSFPFYKVFMQITGSINFLGVIFISYYCEIYKIFYNTVKFKILLKFI